MKRIFTVFTALILLLVHYSFVDPAANYSITVEVNNLRNSEGVVQFALYNKDGTIPDEDYANYYKMQIGNIVNGSSTITFINIPPGTYAVNILHDENRNGKIDKGFILPIEGIGFSNFETIGLTNRPNFEKASFSVKSNTSIEVKVTYM